MDRFSGRGAIQINDVYEDDNAVVFIIDREVGGLYVLETDIQEFRLAFPGVRIDVQF